MRVDAPQAAAMAPVLAVGALSMPMLRYVDFNERHLILRPFFAEFPVQLNRTARGGSLRRIMWWGGFVRWWRRFKAPVAVLLARFDWN